MTKQLEPADIPEEQIASELKGNTLRVYWALLRSPTGVIGVRELQRSLSFSSPALASYHLRKLEDLGLVKEQRGEYHLVRVIHVGILKQFIKVGSAMLPRYVLYAILFTTLLSYFISQFEAFTSDSLFTLVLGGLATAIMWYETIRVWRQLP